MRFILRAIKTTTTMTFDFHCWVVTPKGAICDPDTTREELVEHYKWVSLVRHGHTDFEFVRKEWLKTPPQVIRLIKKYKSFGISGEHWVMFKDAVGCCLQRGLVIKQRNPHCRIAFGSLGLKDKRTGEIWWEHGLGEKNR